MTNIIKFPVRRNRPETDLETAFRYLWRFNITKDNIWLGMAIERLEEVERKQLEEQANMAAYAKQLDDDDLIAQENAKAASSVFNVATLGFVDGVLNSEHYFNKDGNDER